MTETSIKIDHFWRNSQDMLGVADDKGVWLSVNPAWSRILGWTAEEIVGRTSAWMEHPDDRSKTRAEIHSLAAGATTFEFENRFRTRGGDYRSLSWTAAPEDSLLYCVARDVTEERARAAMLAEEAAVRERTWAFTPDLLSIIDMPSATFERVNPAWTSALGWSSGDFEGAPFVDFLHPDDIDASAAAFEQVRRGDPVLRFENRYRAKDGGWRSLSWVAFPEGEKLYSSTRDVTLTKARDASLRLFENIVQSDESPICAYDTSYRVIAYNQAHDREFRRVMGRQARVGETLPDTFEPEQASALRALIDRALAGESFLVEAMFGDADFTIPHWELHFSPVRDEHGVLIGAFHHARDVTDQFKAQAALRSLEEQLRQSQKMEAVGQLTGGLAHDFNNMLAGISGSLEMIQTRLQQGRVNDIGRYVAAALGASTRAAALTHRLLAFSRRQTLDPKPTDINRLVAGMQDLVRRTVGPSISVEVVEAASLWPALVDPSQLENALLNLCLNARDAMPDGGRITIETANKWLDRQTARQQDVPEGQYLSLCVTDTGCGMTQDVIARVFEPFFTTKPFGEGTGLGLSMIYGFAKQSGGQVRVYSEVGEGTTVCIYLPRHYGPAEAQEHITASEVLARSDDGETVLVVDDEPTVRMLIADILSDLGYTTVEAADGAAGLNILNSNARVDLLVTDVGLPGGMNGRQMADAARNARPDLKVLFITGYAENAVLGDGRLEPGMAVMTKPFAVNAMAERIRQMITVT